MNLSLHHPSPNLSVFTASSHVLMGLVFWKSKCAMDTRTAEMAKMKDHSALPKDLVQKPPDAIETNSCAIMANVSTTDSYVMEFGIAERY